MMVTTLCGNCGREHYIEACVAFWCHCGQQLMLDRETIDRALAAQDRQDFTGYARREHQLLLLCPH